SSDLVGHPVELPTLVHSSHPANIIPRQLCLRVRLKTGSCATTPFFHVSHVVSMATRFKMVGVAAQSVVALVPHDYAGREFTMDGHVDRPVRKDAFILPSGLPVSTSLIHVSSPRPARIWATRRIHQRHVSLCRMGRMAKPAHPVILIAME